MDSPDTPAGGPAASDGSLVRQFADGESQAAEELHRRYARRLIAVARNRISPGLGQRLDAEDIVQSVFRRFFRAARAGRYELPAGEEVWSLLAAVTLNRLRSEETKHRAAKRDLRLTVDWEAAGGTAAGVDALAHLGLDDALATLPPHHAEVARLRMDGHEVADIATQTGRSKRTVERILQEMRQRLRERLTAEE